MRTNQHVSLSDVPENEDEDEEDERCRPTRVRALKDLFKNVFMRKYTAAYRRHAAFRRPRCSGGHTPNVHLADQGGCRKQLVSAMSTRGREVERQAAGLASHLMAPRVPLPISPARLRPPLRACLAAGGPHNPPPPSSRCPTARGSGPLLAFVSHEHPVPRTASHPLSPRLLRHSPCCGPLSVAPRLRLATHGNNGVNIQ